MRSRRRALAGVLLPAAVLLLSLPGGTLAQDAAVTYTDGSAQLLLRGGAPKLTAFTLVSGVRGARPSAHARGFCRGPPSVPRRQRRADHAASLERSSGFTRTTADGGRSAVDGRRSADAWAVASLG